MYESFYGFTEKPFQLNPDPSFYYGSKEHGRAMAYLEYGVEKNEGFIVITGEIGAGKTTVVRNLLNTLDPRKVVAAHLVTTHLNAEDTLRMVGASFGMRVKNMPKSEVLLSMEAFLVKLSLKGKRALLVVDEAQNLTVQAMEELRMLSNYQLKTHGLLQSFLVGQPEFRRMLEGSNMKQLRQRVVAACHISAMDMDETRGYVEHRLTHVGWKGDPRFEPEAYEALFAATGGIPRRINSVCDRVLLSGYLTGKHVFSKKEIDDAASEIMEETRGFQPEAAGSPVTMGGTTALEHQAFELGGSIDIDLSRLELDADTASKASSFMAGLQAGELEERLTRLERSSAATMAVLRHLLNAVRTRHPDRKD